MGKHLCPVCGQYEFESRGSFEICEVCGWEDDPLQADEPDFEGGANELSLNQHKAKYEAGWIPDWIKNNEECDYLLELQDKLNDEIMYKMDDCVQMNVLLSFKDGRQMEGYVDTFESRYDNDGEASICFAGVNGEMLIVEESEIADITPVV